MPERDEIDASPHKKLNQNIEGFSDAYGVKRTHTSREFQNSNPQNGSDFDRRISIDEPNANLSPLNIKIEPMTHKSPYSLNKRDENFLNLKNQNMFIPN